MFNNLYIFFLYICSLAFNVKTFILNDATSGILFDAQKIRAFDRKHLSLQNDSGFSQFLNLVKDHKKCKHWAVTTTIFDVSKSINIWLTTNFSNCIVIVADKKTPESTFLNLSKKRVLFLSVDKQIKLSNRIPFIKHLPWNSFSRKNIGYLVAISAKALSIFDMDDDNILYSSNDIKNILDFNLEKFEFVTPNVNSNYINPYDLFLKNEKYSYAWPRGFPLERIKDKKSCFEVSEKPAKIYIWQSLADNDPDVDAIFRLTKPLNIKFESKKALILRKSDFSPLNAQSCVFFKGSFSLLYLPFTVQGRVSDIWRGYISELLIHRILKGNIVISSPLVFQNRNSHNYLADFISENDLYTKSSEFIKILNNFVKTHFSIDILNGINELYIDLYEYGFVELNDVKGIELWKQIISDLQKC